VLLVNKSFAYRRQDIRQDIARGGREAPGELADAARALQRGAALLLAALCLLEPRICTPHMRPSCARNVCFMRALMVCGSRRALHQHSRRALDETSTCSPSRCSWPSRVRAIHLRGVICAKACILQVKKL
jgi:hypothetical protein